VRRRALAEVRRRKEAEAAVHAAHAATAAANENLARVNHELRASTAEAMRLRREAEARSHAKSEFMAVMSHEIRTPLNGVIGMAELLSASGLADKQREIADALCASGRILLGVINDVLDFSKIESGLFTIGSQPLDVRDVVDSAMEVTAHRLRGAAISAAAIVNRAVPTMVMGDANRLRQVLANLLSNAFKFTTQGEVLLRVDRVVSADGAASLRFSVEDTGPGMAPAELERLFQPYQQGESGQLQQSDGSGLGLTISSRLVGLMGGELRVTSEKGTGSRFWFELQEEPVESGALEAHILASAPKVIVISPHGPTRESLEEHVASLGGRVEGVATIAEGAAIAAGLPAHFVVDAACGPDAAVICPASLRAPGQRAVWITTWRDALNRSTVEGYDDILIKPTKRSVLRQTLTRLGSFEVASDTARVASNEQDPDTPGLDLKQQLAGKRVLVVEDNCINRRLCQLQLERLGAVVELAVDGAEGVARFLEKPFDLVITDCQMPVMDGFEAARAMREAEAKNVETFGARRARIIALTANALAGERERCFASGMDGFLVKPFTREQLRQALLEGQSA
jgi:signal transduction histidine kinase/CheY-like chemotaxis protein